MGLQSCTRLKRLSKHTCILPRPGWAILRAACRPLSLKDSGQTAVPGAFLPLILILPPQCCGAHYMVRQRALISGKQAVPGHCVPCLFLGPGYRRQQGPMCVCVQVSFWLPHPRFKFLKRVLEWKGCGEILPGAGLGWAWGPVCLSSKRGALSGPRGSLEGKEPFLSKEGKGD